MSRPYFHAKADELRALVSQHRSEPAILRQIDDELSQRNTDAAKQFRAEVEGLIDSRPTTPPVAPAAAPAAAVDDERRLAVGRVRQLFQFLKAFAERNVPVRRALRDHEWVLSLADLPKHEKIFVGSVVTSTSATAGDGEGLAEAPPLLRIGRPKLHEAPAPPPALVEWIEGAWQDPFKVPRFRETMVRPAPGNEPARTEAF